MNRDSSLDSWRTLALKVEAEVGQAVIGQPRTVRLINVALFARGHVLLEGDVGVGKTTLLRAFARALGGEFERVEGTIDLMPSDLVYHTYVDGDGTPRVEPGPLLRHGEDLAIFFFNEINRARPQVQSLLLRVMAERTVSAFNREYRFPHLHGVRRPQPASSGRRPSSSPAPRATASCSRSRWRRRTTRRSAVARVRPAFHDTDALIDRIAADVVPYRELNAVAALDPAQVRASDALQDYVLALWSATRSPRASASSSTAAATNSCSPAPARAA